MGPAISSIIEQLAPVQSRLLRWASLHEAAGALLALALVVAGWMLLDYTIEPARAVRQWLLAALAFVVVIATARWLAWRYRTAPRLVSDRSIALLLEEKFPRLGDRLITAVELIDRSPEARGFLLDQVIAEADGVLGDLDPGQLVNGRGVRRRLWIAAGLLGGLLALALLAPAIPRTFWARNFQLAEVRYPRQTHLAVVGFPEGKRKVAKGRDAEVVIEADATSLVPERVTLRVTAENGKSSTVYMTRVGENRFIHTVPAVLEPLSFQARGGDDRTDPFQLLVVEPLRLRSIWATCRFPAYTGLEKEDLPVHGSRLVALVGSEVQIVFSLSKPIAAARLVSNGRSIPLAPSGPGELAATILVKESLPLELTAVDEDGIDLAEPIRLELVAERDQPPKIEARAEGIETAVTPIARLPIRIHANDDYGLGKIAFRLRSEKGSLAAPAMEGPTPGAKTFDRQQMLEISPLGLAAGGKLTVQVHAQDRLPSPGPNEALSEPLVFEIVSEGELLSRLATKELNLRQRFEQVLREVGATARDLRDPASGTDVAMLIERAMHELRKNQNETAAIAVEFAGIGQMLQHNRVGNTALIERIDRIARPLSEMAGDDFSDALARLEALRAAKTPATQAEARAAAAQSLAQLLAHGEAILKSMRKLENFNEAVALLRGVIADQERLLEKTQRERKKKVLDLLK